MNAKRLIHGSAIGIGVMVMCLAADDAHAYDRLEAWYEPVSWKRTSPFNYFFDMLVQGNAVVSTNGTFRLTMQSDGNLVEYNQYGVALWSTGTSWAGGGYALMQVDGNFVVYNWADQPTWTNDQQHHPGDGLWEVFQQNDGNVVEYVASGGALHLIWANDQCCFNDPPATQLPNQQRMRISPTFKHANSSGYYKKLYPSQARWSWCASFCSTDSACKSFTYAPPGAEEPQAVCHLANIQAGGGTVIDVRFYFGSKI